MIWTGNPVREEIVAMAPPENRYAARAGQLRLLVVGGSLGAQVLNTVVPEALALLAPEARPRVTHQAGAAHADAVRRPLPARAASTPTVVPFIDDMAARYAETDLIVCRAGATTVAEIAAAGIASMLVPYPHSVDDHQTINARFLADRGAALLVPQRELTAQRLAEVLLRLHARAAAGDGAVGARSAAGPRRRTRWRRRAWSSRGMNTNARGERREARGVKQRIAFLLLSPFSFLLTEVICAA